MFRIRKRAVVSPSSSTSKKNKSKREPRCLTCTNLALGALVPLMIGIFTVVSYVQQQQLTAAHRKQDHEIAQQLHEQDERQTDNLHYQDVFQKYIEDISNVLFKLQQSKETFLDDQTKLEYIRSKTLTALRELDWLRKTHLFVFLYENQLLPRMPQNDSNLSSLDLSGADFVNIILRSTMSKTFKFDRLSLLSVDSTNASFIDCEFVNGTDFSGSTMSGIRFTRSRFVCSNKKGKKTHVRFDGTALERADFRSVRLCDIRMRRVNLTHSSFTQAQLTGRIEIISTDLTYSDFSQVGFYQENLIMVDVNMTGSQGWLDSSSADMLKEDGRLINVIFPNGSWLLDESNLVLNGDADINGSSECPRTILHWKQSDTLGILYPTLSAHPTKSPNSFISNCYFNFVRLNDIKMRMYQTIDVHNFSSFTDSHRLEFRLSADINCSDGSLQILLFFYDIKDAQISSIYFNSRYGENRWCQWLEPQAPKILHIPVGTRRMEVQIDTNKNAVCSLDNIEFRMHRTTYLPRRKRLLLEC